VKNPTPTPHSFFRGSCLISPVNHIVIVIMPNGTEHFRRLSMNADQMSQLERRLMEAQHVGDIAAYVITSASECNFPELLGFIESLKFGAEQPDLLDLRQDTLFSGGAA
jgi:hypothetical protein